MSTISTSKATTATGPARSTRPYRLRGLAVVLAGLVLTGSGGAVVHHFGTPDGTWVGEVASEAVAGAIGYLVAFGLGWWRPRRSRTARSTAERTALVLALVGALLVPICFWNPMPLTFAASALLLLSWSRVSDPRTSGNRGLGSAVTMLSIAVIAVQLVAFVVHVISSS